MNEEREAIVGTITMACQFRVSTAEGQWFFVDAARDGEWDTWSATVEFRADATKAPEEALFELAERAEAFAAAVKAARFVGPHGEKR